MLDSLREIENGMQEMHALQDDTESESEAELVNIDDEVEHTSKEWRTPVVLEPIVTSAVKEEAKRAPTYNLPWTDEEQVVVKPIKSNQAEKVRGTTATISR